MSLREFLLLPVPFSGHNHLVDHSLGQGRPMAWLGVVSADLKTCSDINVLMITCCIINVDPPPEKSCSKVPRNLFGPFNSLEIFF